MIIYSQKIIRFVNQIKSAIKEILSKEIRLKVSGQRFLNQRQTASYPIKVVIFNNKSLLGYFDPAFYELGFHERLMHVSQEQLHNVIRHELAHYITYINLGMTHQPHGIEFRTFCREQGWGEEVYLASMTLEEGVDTPEVDNSVLRKVQKLMALATSSNSNEAEQAMIKSQQLLLKHHIDATQLGNEEERMILKRILKQKKSSAKMSAIAKILETFFVNVIYNRADGYTYLEILGSEVNVEIAEYVAGFLQEELDKLWNQVQRGTTLRGEVAKNSFYMGLAKGYCDKIQALEKRYAPETSHALMVIEKQLVDAKAMVYPRLSSVRRSGGYCQDSSALGERMGRQLTINPALGKAARQTEVLFLG